MKMKRTLTPAAVGLLVWAGCLLPASAQPAYSAAASQVAEKLVAAFPEIQGQVLSILPDGRVLIDLTAAQGAYVGLELEAFRPGEEFKHPVTGEVLGRLHVAVGTLRVSEVQDKFSIASLLKVAENQQLQSGDGVRVTKARILLGCAQASSSVAGDVAKRAATRDLEVALARTGRFEVADDRQMRSTLAKAGLADADQLSLTDPQALAILRRDLRLSVLALPRISPQQDHTLLDVEVVSTLSGQSLLVASVEVPGTATATASKASPQSPVAAAPTQGTPQPLRGGQPTPAWIGPPSELSSVITVNPEFAAGSGAAGTYAVQSLPAGTIAMDFGDVDGDGREELVAITQNEVLIFARQGVAFALKDRIAGASLAEYLTVDVADVNGNGKAEIFVTNLHSRLTGVGLFNRLRSFVLERQDDRYVPIWENVPFYLRVLKTPAYPDGLLLAQRMGAKELYYGPVRRYRWKGKRYVGDSDFRLPKGVNIHGLTLVDLNGDGREEIVRLGEDGTLLVEDRKGKGMARTGESFGLFNHLSFEQPIQDQSEELSKDPKPERGLERKYIERRLVVTPLGPEGRPGILVGLNRIKGGVGRYFESLQTVEGGQVLHLAWNGSRIKKQWETGFNPRNYVADYGLVRLDQGLAVAVLSLDKGFLRRTEAILEILRLSVDK